MDSSDQNLEKLAALGRITRALIHDFNNSLASIMGHADFLIADLPEESEQHLFALNIKRAASQLQDSLSQIRSFSAAPEPQDVTDTQKIISALRPSSPPKSILLVEDREMVLDTIKTMLQREHHLVTSVTDGFAALDMIREHPRKYDILITDYTMPELNGKDLLEDIRQDFKNLPIIIMSGDRESLADLQKDKAQQNIFILSKPLTVLDLKRVIELTHQDTE